MGFKYTPGDAPTGIGSTIVQGVTIEAAVDMPAFTVVKVMRSNVARPARSTTPADGETVTGITTVAAKAGEMVPIRTSGALMSPAPLPVGNLYLGPNGELTSDPNSGAYTIKIGIAPTSDLLILRIDPPVYLA